MFHSAGYFRGVVCPFYEHGLCHRPHCHYRHSKPATKSVVKKLPKFRSRLVAPPQKEPSVAASTSTDKPASDTNKKQSLLLQDGPPKPDQPVHVLSTSSAGQTSSSSSTKEETAGGAEAAASEKLISEVSKMIGKIASFYGSGLDSGSTSGDTTNSNINDKADPPADDIKITSPPEVSSEQIALTTITTTPPNTTTLLPSYVPENCAVVESNYQTPGKPSTNIVAKSEDKMKVPAVSDTTELIDAFPSVAEVSVDVAMLESMLVTEKEIFGDSDKISDDGDSDNDIHGDSVAMDTGMLNTEELAWIEAEFKKITAVPSTAGEMSTANRTSAAEDKKPQKSEKIIDVSLKKKRVAHSNTKVVREPVKLRTTPVSSNFGGSIDKSAVYMGKKRLAKPSEEAPASKRPKLALTPNARIPTKIRQRFLDSFIDEFLKTNSQPQQAYEKALNEEKVLFERASNRMIYMNISTLALKRIRNQTAAQLMQLKDALVEALREYKDDDDELAKTGRVAMAADPPSNSSGKEKESNRIETDSSLASSTRLSSSMSDKADVNSPDPQPSAVFNSSQFYSKKSQKSSTSSVEGTETGAKLKTKSKKAHSKKKKLSKATTSDTTKSESGNHFSQALANLDQVQTKVSTGSTVAPASSGPSNSSDKSVSGEVAGLKREKKSKLKKDKHLPKKARHSKDGTTPTHRISADSSQRDPLSEPKEVVKKFRSSSLSSTPSITSSTTAQNALPHAKRLSETMDSPSPAMASKDSAQATFSKDGAPASIHRASSISDESSKQDPLSVSSKLPKISESFSLASSSGLEMRLVPSISKPSSSIGGHNTIIRLSETTESIKKLKCSRDGTPLSTSSKKPKPSKEVPTVSLSTTVGRTSAGSAQDILTMLSESQDALWAEPETKDSLKKCRHSRDDTPPSTHATSCKKARPSKEETIATSPRMVSMSAESAQDILTTLSGSQDASWGADPMDLAAELFGGIDSDSEGEDKERRVVSNIIERIISEGGEEEHTATESDEVSCSQGISFESALCGVGIAKTKRGGVSNKLKSPKKHKKKSKIKLSSNRVQMEESEGKRSTRPTQLDLSVFSRKSPTVRLVKTPTGHGLSPLSPTSSSGPTTPTGHMTTSGSTMPTDISHTGVYMNEGQSSQHSSEAASASADMAPSKETSDVKETITSPLHLPSGPFINLTKVAARHKEKQMSYNVMSIVAKHAAMEKARKKKATPKAPPTTQRKKAIPTAAPPTTKQPTKPTFSIIRRKEIELTAPLFYSHMKSYILSEDQLRGNSYPRPTARPGEATIHRDASSSSQQSSEIRPVGPNAMEHRCCRCTKMFIIYNSGQYQKVEECVYHYGRLIKNKEYGEGVVSKYTCCQGRRDSAGCQVAKFHVTAGERPTLDKGYVTTEAPPTDSTYHPSVYALDCEMCYTTAGLQLTRVSVINMSLQPIYEKLVKPSHPIVDYNTRFSGLTNEDLVGVETTLEDVQADLLKLFFTDTILLGHSLESDLIALKLIHSCVVDTAIVFPHRKGPPYKRALKTLMAEYMQKFIQDSIDGGHDSLEDSRACMELMLWKIKQDLKKVCRTSSTSDK